MDISSFGAPLNSLSAFLDRENAEDEMPTPVCMDTGVRTFFGPFVSFEVYVHSSAFIYALQLDNLRCMYTPTGVFTCCK